MNPIYNIVYDLIIIGASKDGIEIAASYLNTDKKICLVSENITNVPETFNHTNITVINDAVIFSSFNHGLLGFNLITKESVYGKIAVIATGTIPKKLSKFNYSGVYYKLEDIPTDHKLQPLVISGMDTEIGKAAVKLAKKFKFIYICTNTAELELDAKLREKIAACSNITHLPLCNITSCKADTNGVLKKVNLDTFTSIDCNDLFLKTTRVADVPQLAKGMITVSDAGAIKTDKTGRTNLPTLFAVGRCSEENISAKTIIKSLKSIV